MSEEVRNVQLRPSLTAEQAELAEAQIAARLAAHIRGQEPVPEPQTVEWECPVCGKVETDVIEP